MKHNKQSIGCLYYFFNETEVTKKKQKIHKIVPKDFYILNELTNQDKLLNINNRKKHFYLIEKTSELKFTEINEHDTAIKHTTFNHDDTILVDLEHRELIYFKNYLLSLSSSRKYLFFIINSYKHLLNSIQLLVNNHICHNHIHFDSLLIDSSEFILLSNFSFSIDYLRANNTDYITRFIIEYDPSYLEWPIELHILSYMITNKINSLSSYNIEIIITEYITAHSIINTFGQTVVSSFKDEGLTYFNKYINQTYEYILTDVLQFAHTWDNYALSILYLRILIGLHRTIHINNKFVIQFMKLLLCNIQLNPFKRNTIDSSINKFTILLNSLQPRDYKDIIHKLMTA